MPYKEYCLEIEADPTNSLDMLDCLTASNDRLKTMDEPQRGSLSFAIAKFLATEAGRAGLQAFYDNAHYRRDFHAATGIRMTKVP